MGKQQKAAGASSSKDKSMEDEIRSLAYRFYCEGGYQDGRDLDHWMQAEQHVLARRNTPLRRVA